MVCISGKKICINGLLFLLFFNFFYFFLPASAFGQSENDLLFSLDFDEKNFTSIQGRSPVVYDEGIEGKGLDLAGSRAIPPLQNTELNWFSKSRDFSVSLWINTNQKTSGPAIIVSNADFSLEDAGIYGERRTNKGITLYGNNGAWGWNIGNGGLHYNYEPIETDQPIADNKWHHLAFTFHAKLKEVRLFYDGINKAVLHVGDLDERDFISDLPLRIGGDEQVSPGYRSFPGVIDEFQVWGSVLSPEYIKAEYEEYFTAAVEPELKTDTFTVVDWNIWHGGTHFTKEENGFDGIERITELIRKAGADIVLMQETYGAGSRISSSLGYYYYEASSTVGAVWGANLSVMSRFPIEDAYMVEKRGNYGNNYAFNNGGVKVRFSERQSVIAFSNWYNGSKPEDLDAVLKTWSGLIANSDQIPIVTGGDFNSKSHLDDGEGRSGHSKLMAGAGFIDSFRELHPDAAKYPGYSNGGASSRIDYIYYKGKGISAVESGPIVPNFNGREDRTPGYPSDHLGIVTKFRIQDLEPLVRFDRRGVDLGALFE